MMKSLLLSLLAYCAITNVSAQNFSLNNQVLFGSSGTEYLSNVIHTSDGGFLIVSQSNTNGGDRLNTTYGGFDYWVVKLNNSSVVQWEKSFGGSGDDFVTGAIELSSGNFLIHGYSNSPISGVKSTAGYGGNDFWVIEISNNGSYITDQTFGSTANDALTSVVQMNGKYYLAGESFGGVDGVKTLPSFGQSDIWLIETDLSFNILSQKVFGGDKSEYGALMKNINDTLTIVCTSYSDVSGNKTAPLYGINNGWLFKLDVVNDIYKEVTLGGTGSETINDFVWFDNSYVLIGATDSPPSGTKTCQMHGIIDGWLIRLDVNFNNMYQFGFGNSNMNGFLKLGTRTNGKLFIVGNTNETPYQYRTDPDYGMADAYLIGLDSSLVYEWDFSWGGTKSESLVAVFEPYHNEFVFFGYSGSSNSGSIDVSNHGVNTDDIYWGKITSLLSTNSFKISNVEIFPNPAHDVLIIRSLDEEMSDIKIYSSQGKLILEIVMPDKELNIDLNQLNQGSYFVEINNKMYSIVKE